MSEQADKEMEELHRQVMDNGGKLKETLDMINADKKKEARAGEVLAVIVVVLPIAFAVSAYAAWLMTYAWGWFVVPLGFKAIGFIHMWGLVTFVSFFTTKKPEKAPENFFNWSCEIISMNFFKYSLAFGMCYVLHKMM